MSQGQAIINKSQAYQKLASISFQITQEEPKRYLITQKEYQSSKKLNFGPNKTQVQAIIVYHQNLVIMMVMFIKTQEL